MKVTYKFSKTNVLCTYVATSKNLDKTGTLINPRQPTFQIWKQLLTMHYFKELMYIVQPGSAKRVDDHY